VVFETYANGLGRHDRHILMSATKSVVGLLVGVLVDQGVLDVAAPVTAYVPEMASGPYAGATLRHLLDMQAGVKLSLEQQHAYGLASGWEPTGPSPWTSSARRGRPAGSARRCGTSRGWVSAWSRTIR
jgi:CubicO group peptidase (beta-lactamase class C family)